MYKILNKINSGNSAKIFECIKENSEQKLIAKIFKKPIKEFFDEEIKILNKCKSQNIIELIDFIYKDFTLIFPKYYLNLQEFLNTSQLNNDYYQIIHKIIPQILDGVNYIHNNEIIHTDLNIDNIMFVDNNFSQPQIKICDFSCAIFNNKIYNHYVQSDMNRAPEIIMEIKYSNKIDIWELGCVFFHLILKEHPFLLEDKEGESEEEESKEEESEGESKEEESDEGESKEEESDEGESDSKKSDEESDSKKSDEESEENESDEEESEEEKNIYDFIHLLKIIGFCGNIPSQIYKKSKKYDLYFDKNGCLKYYFLQYNMIKNKKISEIINEKLENINGEKYENFLLKMWNWDEEKRMNASELKKYFIENFLI